MGKKSSKGFETEVAIIGEHNVNNINSFCSFGKRNFNGRNDTNVFSQIQCVYRNADSFLNKMEEFKTRFIEDKPDIVMITEVLPQNNRYDISKTELSLEGYDIFPENFPSANTRGILIYAKQELQATEITVNHEIKEVVSISINLVNNDKLFVCCFYRSSSSSETNCVLLNDLLCNLSNIENSFSYILLTEYFNFPSIDWNTWSARDSVSQNFLECIRDCYLQQVIDQPTRYRLNQEPSLLDLILVNDRNCKRNLEFKDPLEHSDHCVLTFEFLCHVKPNITRSVKFNYFQADFANLRKEMDIDLKSYYQKCSNKPRKTPLSEQTRRIIREKHRSWEKYRKCKDNDSYRKYTRARNKAKSTITRERKQREKEIAESAKTNCKNFWSYINSKKEES